CFDFSSLSLHDALPILFLFYCFIIPSTTLTVLLVTHLFKTYLTSPLFYCMIGTVVPERLFVLYRNRCSLSSGFRKNDMMLVTQTDRKSTRLNSSHVSIS